MIVLDTNILSEVIRPAPEPAVLRWLAAQPAASVFISAITEAELRYGVAVLPAGKRRSDRRHDRGGFSRAHPALR
jgi:predicted nucleic acid-binding protein